MMPHRVASSSPICTVKVLYMTRPYTILHLFRKLLITRRPSNHVFHSSTSKFLGVAWISGSNVEFLILEKHSKPMKMIIYYVFFSSSFCNYFLFIQVCHHLKTVLSLKSSMRLFARSLKRSLLTYLSVCSRVKVFK